MTSRVELNNPNRQYICPVFDKDFPKLSLIAVGVLGQMINEPELDYCTMDKLYNSNSADGIADITDAVEELISKGCLIKTSENKLAVDKHLLVQMQIVSGSSNINVEGE